MPINVRASINKKYDCDNHVIILSKHSHAFWNKTESIGFGWNCNLFYQRKKTM